VGGVIRQRRPKKRGLRALGKKPITQFSKGRGPCKIISDWLGGGMKTMKQNKSQFLGKLEIVSFQGAHVGKHGFSHS